MRIAIFGTGGVGANFGGYMAKAGVEIVFVARGENLKAIRADGLEIETPKGNIEIKPVTVTDDLAEMPAVDVIFVCTKAWQLEEAARAIKPALAPETFILPLQNSIEAPDRLGELLGDDRVLGGVCYTTSFILAPGRIRGNGGLIILGERDGKPRKRSEQLAEIIRKTPGLDCQNAPDIRKSMWKKFAWISSASAIGAVTRAPRHAWRGLAPPKKLFDDLLEEAFAVAHASGVPLGDAERSEIIAFLDKTDPGFTTSMQRDVMEGKRSELEYQLGSILQIAKRLNVPTPISEAVFASLLPQEQRAQRKIAF